MIDCFHDHQGDARGGGDHDGGHRGGGDHGGDGGGHRGGGDHWDQSWVFSFPIEMVPWIVGQVACHRLPGRGRYSYCHKYVPIGPIDRNNPQDASLWMDTNLNASGNSVKTGVGAGTGNGNRLKIRCGI